MGEAWNILERRMRIVHSPVFGRTGSAIGVAREHAFSLRSDRYHLGQHNSVHAFTGWVGFNGANEVDSREIARQEHTAFRLQPFIGP